VKESPSARLDDSFTAGASYQPLFRGGDAQTIAGRYWPGGLVQARWPTQSQFFQTAPDVQVLGKINRGGGRGVVIAVHGLTACSEARYMLTLAHRALEDGFDVIRLNVRSCGGTELLSPTLYHSGLTDDLRSVVDQLAPENLYLVGFSMGGNMVLKLAGEWGGQAPRHVRGVCAVSAPIRLAECARRIGERRNWIYEYRFLRQLRAAVKTKQRLDPQFWPDLDPDRADSIYSFDELITARTFGFESAADYYERSSAAGYLDRVRLPALLIQAEDDPFIPFSTYRHAAFQQNNALRLLHTGSGGHVAFLARGAARFWAEDQAVRFFDSLAVRPNES
jgi:predicted alpha/beta-fold hydrolase